VLVEALDQDGNLCPLAMNDVKFTLEGPEHRGVANGDHHFPAEFDTTESNSFTARRCSLCALPKTKGALFSQRNERWRAQDRGFAEIS